MCEVSTNLSACVDVVCSWGVGARVKTGINWHAWSRAEIGRTADLHVVSSG